MLSVFHKHKSMFNQYQISTVFMQKAIRKIQTQLNRDKYVEMNHLRGTVASCEE